jgi:hypothetical protein
MPPMRGCLRARCCSRSTGSGSGFQRRSGVQRPVRPVLIVVGLVLAQDPPQMVLIRDESAVKKLVPASPGPAFGDRVHARRPHVAGHGPDPRISEDRVERSRVVRAAIADHDLDLVRLLAEVHDQVAGLLGGPVPGGMQSDPEDANAPGGMLDHGQDVSPGAIQQVRGEEIAREDRLGLGAQELRPGRVCSSRRGVDPGISSGFPARPTPLPSLAGRLARRGSCGSPSQGSRGPAGAPGP